MQTTIGIRELKTHLSRYLRRVRQGETLIITDRGRPIGQLAPYRQTAIERLAQLQNSGLLAWSGKKLNPQTPAVKPKSAQSVSDLLLADRE